MIDFESYLRRIGLAGTDSPSWQAIHRAHATSIPFENLDPTAASRSRSNSRTSSASS